MWARPLCVNSSQTSRKAGNASVLYSQNSSCETGWQETDLCPKTQSKGVPEKWMVFQNRQSSLPSWWMAYATTEGFVTFWNYLLIHVMRGSAWDWVRTHRGDRCHASKEGWTQRHIFRVGGQEPIQRFWNFSSISEVCIKGSGHLFERSRFLSYSI